MLSVTLILCFVLTAVRGSTTLAPTTFDPCAKAPCLNGGTCYIKGETYSCQCAQGYRGTDCNEKFSNSVCRPGWTAKTPIVGRISVCYKQFQESVTWNKAWKICHDQQATMDAHFNLGQCRYECPVDYLNGQDIGSVLWTGGHVVSGALRWDGYKKPTMQLQYNMEGDFPFPPSFSWDETAFTNTEDKCVSMRVNTKDTFGELPRKTTGEAARRKRAAVESQFSLLTDRCEGTTHSFGCVSTWENSAVATFPADERLCPQGYDFQSDELGLCFRYYPFTVNKTVAVETCKSTGGEILTLRTQYDMNLIRSLRQSFAQKFAKQEVTTLGTNWVEIETTFRRSCYAFDGETYQQYNCIDSAFQVMCQTKKLTDKVQFLSPRQDQNIVANQNIQTITCSLNAASRETDIYWVKRNKVLEGFTSKNSKDLTMAVSLNVTRSGINRNVFKSYADVPGYYWCEKIANNPSETIRSKQVFVDLPEDYLVYVVSIHLGAGQYPFKECNQRNLMGTLLSSENPLSIAFNDFKSVIPDFRPKSIQSVDSTTIQATLIDVECKSFILNLHLMMKLFANPQIKYDESINVEYEKQIMSGFSGRQTQELLKFIQFKSVVCQTTSKLYRGSSEYKVTFQGGKIGQSRDSSEFCHADGTPMATATCEGDFYTGARWNIIMSQTCNFTDLVNSNSTTTLRGLSQSETNTKTVEGIINDTKILTVDPDVLTAKDVIYVADILDNVINTGHITPTIAEFALSVVDQVMSVDAEKIDLADARGSAAQRVLKAVDAIGVQTDLLVDTQFQTLQSNIALEIWEMSGSSDIVVGLMLTEEASKTKTSVRPLTNDSLFTLNDEPELKVPISDAAILLPAKFIRKTLKDLGTDTLRLSMHIYNNRKLFIPYPRQAEKVYTANSKVVAGTLSVQKTLVANLEGDLVTTVFLPFQESEETTCGYWKHGVTPGSHGMWATDGCKKYGKVDGRHVCLCDHLTNFAILMDFEGQEPIPEAHKLALSIITIIGLSISIAALFLTILSFIIFKKLREGRGQKTLFHLSIALILSWIIFLAGINQTQDHNGCIAVAVLIHYFLLVAFMWMCVEAVLQYLRFVRVLGTYIPKFMLKTAIPAWGLPLIPVIIVLAIDYELYKGGDEYCWMSLTAFYYSFAIPVGIMILFNLIVYFIVIWNICRRPKGLKSTQSESELRMLNVRAALSVFILLGLTWLFGFLTISEARIVFNYIFAILNAFQGLFIFVLFTLRDKYFRQEWSKLCCRRKSKPGQKKYVQYSSGSDPVSYQSSNSTDTSKGRSSISSDVPVVMVNKAFDG